LNKIVIGYGTGRCGTKSLATFLTKQGYNVTHEGVALGWYQALTDTEATIRDFVSQKGVIGDVGFYWINYLDLILRKYPAKAINILRDDDEVIESFWSYKKPELQNLCNNTWKGYPFDSDVQTKEAIAFTIKRYRFLEASVVKMYPASIYRLKTDDLNNKAKLDSLLEWLDYDGFRILKPVHTNKREQILSKNANRRLDFPKRSRREN